MKKNQKEKVLADIHQMMRQNRLTPDDVKEYSRKHISSAEFDVLCLIRGKKKRLRFKDRGDHTVIGIFPFSDEPTYIELKEAENKAHTDDDVDEKHLPDVDFCERVSEIIKPLNACLTMLESPILKGDYLADSSYMKGAGWIVAFHPDKPGQLDNDYYGGNERAKCRYVKKFRNWPTLF